MKTKAITLVALLVALATLTSCANRPKPIPEVIVVAPESEAGAIDFRRDIVPLLERQCVTCHHDNGALTDLSFQRRENMLEAETGGRPVLVPGDASHSTLFLVTVMPDYFIEAMPAGGHQLDKATTDKLFHWIEAGAPWPEGLVLQPEMES